MSKNKIDWGHHLYPFKMKSYVLVNGKEVEKEIFSFLLEDDAIAFAKELDAKTVKIMDEEGKILHTITPTVPAKPIVFDEPVVEPVPETVVQPVVIDEPVVEPAPVVDPIPASDEE